MIEIPVVFNSRGKQLIGVCHQAKNTGDKNVTDKGVVIVVGGPQTKFGSHRQFVTLARFLAEQGIHVFRFDYSGAGDSEGEVSAFEDIQPDIDAAINAFIEIQKDVEQITLWGLCDAASAIAMFLAQDSESLNTESLTTHSLVNNVVLLNPWVRQPATEAKTYLRYYYLQRLCDISFWKKLFSGKLSFTKSFNDINQLTEQAKASVQSSYVDVMFCGLKNFNGNIQIIISGNDITGGEFRLLCSSAQNWKTLTFTQVDVIKEANHTFARQNWKKQVEKLTLQSVVAS
ncbi:MAG: hydrolase 1, exosortase A system-associated [Alteromonadaceae bacterium]|nr:hydrolase 1, exosortase A system-associated [Alteromonadaceae bacterium]